MKLTLRIGCLFATAALALTGAQGATVYGLTDGQHLVTFASGTPGTFLTDVAITGLPAGYELIGMDMRTTTQTVGAANPGVGTLWALGTNMTDYRLFVVSTSGAVTAIGGLLTPMTSVAVGVGNWGFAFNPGKDRFEAVGERHNFEIDPNTATAVTETNVFTSDSAFPAFSGATFSTGSFGGPTTFYIADAGSDRLASSANISAGGLIGFNGSAAGFGVGLDVSPPNALDSADGLTLFASAKDNTLYSVNLSTGGASMVGAISGATELRGMAIQPASFPGQLAVTVKIKGPKKVTTTSTKLTIKGTASSVAGITLVQYKIGKGKFKNAKGTTNWKFTAKLKPGVNKISVQATGGNAVKSAIAKIKVKVTQ